MPVADRRHPLRLTALRLSLIALLAAGLAAVTLIAAPARADISPASAKLVSPVGEEARGSNYGKDWRHTVQVIANLRATPPEDPVVILLGGSSARESTVLDADWSRQIERRGGYRVVALNLASKHRTYAQDLEFVKLLPAHVPAIVYIGINLGRFCAPPTSPKIRLPRPGPVGPYSQHVYTKSRIQSAALKRYYVSYWMTRRWPEFKRNYSYEMGMLQRIVRACKRRHLRVALLDLPRDLPIIGSRFNPAVSRYHRGCSQLARKYDIPWLHFVAGASLTDRDFFDIFHLVEPGRVKYQSMLSDKTIRLLEKYRMPKPEPTPTPSPSPSVSPSASPTAGA